MRPRRLSLLVWTARSSSTEWRRLAFSPPLEVRSCAASSLHIGDPSRRGSSVDWRNLLLPLLTAVLCTCAQVDPRPLSLEALTVQPGTLVTKSTGQNGEEVVEIRRGGVVITRTAGQEVAIDESGHGAVMCMRAFLLFAREAVEACGSADDADMKAYLDGAIGEVDDFIVANSLKPITKAELAGQAAKEIDAVNAGLQSLSPDVRRAKCESEQWRKARDWANGLTDGKYIRELLSTPRPPVINPCT
jgi:hypothetical protein